MDPELGPNPSTVIQERLPRWNFGEFRKALEGITGNLPSARAIEALTRIYDHLPGWDIGSKDRGAVIHIVRNEINSLLDHVPSLLDPIQEKMGWSA
jgi:hypothetical protein